MQNFKSYLKENQPQNKGGCIVKYVVSFLIDGNQLGKEQILKLRPSFVEDYSVTDSSSSIGNWWLIVGFKVDNEFNHDVKTKFINSIRNLSDKFDTAILSISSGTLLVDGFPTHKLVNGNITLNCDSENGSIIIQNLSGIQNYLECFKLTVLGSYQVISNVLGIFKIKNIETFGYDEEDVNEGQEWQPIIEKHIKNKNLISAAEELIENGLKEYAKF